jgi:radical SAM protein (TIGR01212 family)
MDPFEDVRQSGYHTFSAYLRRRFGGRVVKVSLDAGFSCPHREGGRGPGGCAYCVNESFARVGPVAAEDVRGQMMRAMQRPAGADRPVGYIAYFQPFTNTYAPLDVLRAAYGAVAELPGVVALAVGTRPDCVPDDVLDLLQEYGRRLELWVEYGVQSAHDHTLRRIRRGHDFAAFQDAMRRTRGRGLKTCAHVILGLPGESAEDMAETARRVDATGIDGIKLHHLYIARGSQTEAEYRAGGVSLLSAQQYVPLACDFLERLGPQVVVQRLCSDTIRPDLLVAPRWDMTKTQVIQAITREFRRRGTHQGCRCPRSGVP